MAKSLNLLGSNICRIRDIDILQHILCDCRHIAIIFQRYVRLYSKTKPPLICNSVWPNMKRDIITTNHELISKSSTHLIAFNNDISGYIEKTVDLSSLNLLHAILFYIGKYLEKIVNKHQLFDPPPI